MEHQKNSQMVVIASCGHRFNYRFVPGGKVYVRWKKDNEKVKSLVTAARVLNASGDYEGAWQKLEQALVIRAVLGRGESRAVNTAIYGYAIFQWTTHGREKNIWRDR